jgi:hypothetical protein
MEAGQQFKQDMNSTSTVSSAGTAEPQIFIEGETRREKKAETLQDLVQKKSLFWRASETVEVIGAVIMVIYLLCGAALGTALLLHTFRF